MSTQVVVALISAIVALVSVTITFILGLKTVSTEREKLKLERGRLQTEIAKLAKESEKLKIETDDMRHRRIEEDKLKLVVEKQKAISLMERRNGIYPELLELIYRLRNYLRDNVDFLNFLEKNNQFRHPPEEIGQELYLLTDYLYQYRAFIDIETFNLMHKYKRLLQDAKVLTNRMTRPDSNANDQEDDSKEKILQESKIRCIEVTSELQVIYKEVDNLYPLITKSVQNHFESIINRKEE